MRTCGKKSEEGVKAESKNQGGNRKNGETARIFQGIILFALALILVGCGGEELSQEDIQRLTAEGQSQPLHVLVVDDDEGLADTATWTDTLDTLGVTYDVDVVPLNGDPATPLAAYRVVIWSIGDRAFDNLMPGNLALLTTYLDGGGSLLYSGGHGVFDETQPGAATFISTYLGLAGFNFNMPTFIDRIQPAATTGLGHPAAGSTTYTLWDWTGGQYGNMFSGFYEGPASATGLLDHQAANLDRAGAPNYLGFLGMANDPGVYKTVTWGFDLNHVDPANRTELLGRALVFLAQ